MRKVKKKRWRIKKSVITKLIILVCLIGVVYSCKNIIKWKKNNAENAKIKEEIDKSIQIIENTNSSVEEYKIDFSTLKEKNTDTIAYIKVNNTNIDYIVVKGNDNSYYLNHNFNKKYNVSGWIFADFHNKFDDSDKNIVIYGHNTHDGSMFGTLKNVLEKE